MAEVKCNCCGESDWRDMGGRKGVRCAKCNSLERTRYLKLLLDKSEILRPGIRVLHFAPEKSLFSIFDREDIDYDAVDFSPENFPFCRARKFDICVDAATLPCDHYDLIIHSHVMEHVPCNVTASLYHIHRALKPNGVHLMCVPFQGATSAEDLGELNKKDAIEHFGQDDHVRRFGKEDVQRNLGMIFRIPDNYSMLNYASLDELNYVNIPERERTGFTGSTIFILKKDDLLLRRSSDANFY